MIKTRKTTEKFIICDLCKQEITKKHIYTYSNGDFCGEPCNLFYTFATREDFLEDRLKPTVEVVDTTPKKSDLPAPYFDVSQGGNS